MRKGYRKKPQYIYLIGLFYFLVPFLTLLQFWIKVDYSFNLLKEIIFSNFFLSEIFFSFTAGLAVLLVSRIGFYYLIVLNFYTLSIKLYNLNFNSLFEYPLDFFVILFWFMMTMLFLFTAMRVPYLNPETRWWRQPPRYGYRISGKLLVENVQFPITTLNISLGGIFVILYEQFYKEVINDESFKGKLAIFPHFVDQKVEIDVEVIPAGRNIFKEGKLKRQARVAWCSRGEHEYQYGLGLQFIQQNSQQKNELKQYLTLLKRLKFGIDHR